MLSQFAIDPALALSPDFSDSTSFHRILPSRSNQDSAGCAGFIDSYDCPFTAFLSDQLRKLRRIIIEMKFIFTCFVRLALSYVFLLVSFNIYGKAIEKLR